MTVTVTVTEATLSCLLGPQAARFHCRRLAAMYLQRGPLIAENKSPTHRAHRPAMSHSVMQFGHIFQHRFAVAIGAKFIVLELSVQSLLESVDFISKSKCFAA